MSNERRIAYVTGDKARPETFRAAQGGRTPLTHAVTYTVDNGERAGGILETSSAAVRLIDDRGNVVFATPLAGITGTSFPRLRADRVEFSVDGRRYTVRFGVAVWAEVTDSRGRVLPDDDDVFSASALDTTPMVGPAAGDTSTGAAVSLLIDAGARAAGGFDRALARREWKKVLEGERRPEELMVEYGRQCEELHREMIAEDDPG